MQTSTHCIRDFKWLLCQLEQSACLLSFGNSCLAALCVVTGATSVVRASTQATTFKPGLNLQKQNLHVDDSSWLAWLGFVPLGLCSSSTVQQPDWSSTCSTPPHPDVEQCICLLCFQWLRPVTLELFVLLADVMAVLGQHCWHRQQGSSGCGMVPLWDVNGLLQSSFKPSVLHI